MKQMIMKHANKSKLNFPPDFNLISLIDKWGNFNHEVLFMGYFGSIASQFIFEELDMEKFHREFPKRFHKQILACYLKKNVIREDWEGDFTYVLEKEIIVYKERNEVTVFFHQDNCDFLNEIFSFTKAMKKDEGNKAHISLIIMQPHGLNNRRINFEKPQLNLEKVYNEDFQSFHKQMLKILQEENKSGLHLLYGKPGTGKSTYIRYLCGLVKKEIVFLPGQMAQNLDNIAMTKYLMNNPNSVLVIEDAEELIVSRDQQRNSNLAMILNITDGILGESLGIQIIATFNTELQNIDPALKRKGRLKSAYEFKPLPAKKANLLLQEQDTGYATEEEMTLAEIFNISEEEQYKGPEKRAVGFR